MTAITISSTDVSVHPDAKVIRGVLGEAATAGQAVYLDNATTSWKLANGSAAGTAKARGVVSGSAILGASYPVGANVDIVTHGIVTVGTAAGMTLGDPIYIGDTAGQLNDAAGTVTWVIGWVSDANSIYVAPQVA